MTLSFGRKWTDDEDNIIREMHEDGCPPSEIARAVDRSRRAVVWRIGMLSREATMRGDVPPNGEWPDAIKELARHEYRFKPARLYVNPDPWANPELCAGGKSPPPAYTLGGVSW